MKIKIKKLRDNAVIPHYAHATDAGMDLYCSTIVVTQTVMGCMYRCNTGIAVEIPEGYVGLIFPRSSVCKTDFRLSNCVGVIDSGYRGEISMVFDDLCLDLGRYTEGDRIGQLIIMPYPKVEFEEVDELSTSDRGEGGYGSTGK